MRLCVEVFQKFEINEDATDENDLRLQRMSLQLIRQLFENSDTYSLLEFEIDHLIIAELGRSAVLRSDLLQSDLLDTLLLVLNAKIAAARSRQAIQERSSEEGRGLGPQKPSGPILPSLKIRSSESDVSPVALIKPHPALLDCLLKGIADPSSHGLIRKWIQALCETTPMYLSSTFTTLMTIVECFCQQIDICFTGMRIQYQGMSPNDRDYEMTLLHLLNGIDFILAQAHNQLLSEEENITLATSPEPQQGFFGNMVLGTLSSEAKQARNITGNHRLTLVLCFQDTLKACFKLWSWQASDSVDSTETLASFQHSSQKMRVRSRKILEHLFAAEPFECIEVLVGIWVQAMMADEIVKVASVMDLLNTLEGSRPRATMTGIFNATYSRTNPDALDIRHKSTLSSNLHESDLAAFLVVYAQSLEDDVLDEIWKDCTTFLRDILSNPMPHRQILARLINFIAVLGAKMENTNFGEEWKMRKELSDILVRLLTAVFTTKPNSLPRDKTPGTASQVGLKAGIGTDNVEDVLDQNFGTFAHLLGEADRLVTVMANLVSNVIAPLFRSRLFPQNLKPTTLNLLLKISRIPNSSKAWKKELMESFNDYRFLSSSASLAKDGWLPLLRQLALVEKGLLLELLSRLTVPTTAGILFGVGATAARLEADKKAQVNLRRIAALLLAMDADAFAANFGMLQSKLEELLTATSISSPSSTTRAEIFMTIRALVLTSSSSVQMAGFWPMINAELRAAFTSCLNDDGDDPSSAPLYNNYSLLQAAKLLDVLLLTNPDDFQPQEWIFITDTADAIYRPEGWEPTALIDEVAESMAEAMDAPKSAIALSWQQHDDHFPGSGSLQRPWLSGEQTRAIAEHDVRDGLLRPFFGQLSIHVYERTYSLGVPDLEACKDDLVADLFNEKTIVGA
jgi:hypothetical protein